MMNNNLSLFSFIHYTIRTFLNYTLQLDIIPNPLSVNLTRWFNPLKQFAGKLPTNCLNAFDHFVDLALTGLI